MTAEAPGDAVRVGVAAEEDGLLREAGIVPWWWIEDETRTLTDWRCGESVAHCIMEGIDQARINPWSDRPPLVLCESRATAGVLRSLAGEFVVPIAGTAGQVGGFLGDLDDAGEDIEANTRSVLESIVGFTIPWTRIGITREQIAERGIEPIMKIDGRYKDGNPHRAWEVEALGQRTVVGLVREALIGLLPEPLERVQEREGLRHGPSASGRGGWWRTRTATPNPPSAFSAPGDRHVPRSPAAAPWERRCRGPGRQPWAHDDAAKRTSSTGSWTA